MKLLMSVLAGVASVALVGCAPAQWRLNGQPQSKFAADRYRCAQQARTGFAAGGTGYAGMGLIIGTAAAAQSQESYLFTLCMEAAGYTPVEGGGVIPGAGTIVFSASAAPSEAAPQPAPPRDNAPPGKIDPAVYYQPYPGAAPVPVRPPGAPVQPEYVIRGPGESSAGATPQVAGIKAQSTHLMSAEKLARDNGCAAPQAAMSAKGAGQESFVVGCQNGAVIAIQCSFDGCRILH